MRGRGPAWTGDPGGRAEGIMCAYSDLKLTNDTSGGAPVPSCANEYLLQTVLREQFQSPAVVQSDCCDSVSVHHRSFRPSCVVIRSDSPRVLAPTKFSYSFCISVGRGADS